MSQQDKGKQSNKYPRVKMFNKLSKKKQCLKINKNQTYKKKPSSLSHRRIILVITATAGWMMVLEALSDVQLPLLHTEVYRVNLLLH